MCWKDESPGRLAGRGCFRGWVGGWAHLAWAWVLWDADRTPVEWFDGMAVLKGCVCGCAEKMAEDRWEPAVGAWWGPWWGQVGSWELRLQRQQAWWTCAHMTSHYCSMVPLSHGVNHTQQLSNLGTSGSFPWVSWWCVPRITFYFECYFIHLWIHVGPTCWHYRVCGGSSLKHT